MKLVPSAFPKQGSSLWFITMSVAMRVLLLAMWLYEKAGHGDVAHAIGSAARQKLIRLANHPEHTVH